MRPAALLPIPLRLLAAAAVITTPASLALAHRATAATPTSISATATPSEIPLGGSVSVSGRLSGEPDATAGQAIRLEAEPYPYHSFMPIAQGQSQADGSFEFPVARPNENSRLRVTLAATPASRSLDIQVTVDPRVAIHASSLGPGRERLSLRIDHTTSVRAVESDVFWYLALRHSTLFKLAAMSTSRELAAGVTYASAIVDPPASRFSYRVCLNPSWEAAMGPAATHGSCPARDFRLISAI